MCKPGVAQLVHALRSRIDRILRCAVGGNVNVNSLARSFVKNWNLQSCHSAGVCHPNARPARRSADADAMTRRRSVTASEESDREVDHLIDLARLNQSIMIEHGAIGCL